MEKRQKKITKVILRNNYWVVVQQVKNIGLVYPQLRTNVFILLCPLKNSMWKGTLTPWMPWIFYSVSLLFFHKSQDSLEKGGGGCTERLLV